MRLRTTLQATGKNTTGIEVPEHLVAELGAGRRPPVSVTINDYSYPSTISMMGGRFLIPVSADVRSKVSVAAGDDIDVLIELDTSPRKVAIPDDLQAALAAEPHVRQAFDSLSYSNQRRVVLAVEGAKTAATRRRRITSAMAELRQSKAPKEPRS